MSGETELDIRVAQLRARVAAAELCTRVKSADWATVAADHVWSALHFLLARIIHARAHTPTSLFQLCTIHTITWAVSQCSYVQITADYLSHKKSFVLASFRLHNFVCYFVSNLIQHKYGKEVKNTFLIVFLQFVQSCKLQKKTVNQISSDFSSEYYVLFGS